MKIIGSLNNAWCTAGASGEVMSGDLLNKIGIDGRSAYEVAVADGFEGSEAEWLESLREPAVEAAVVAEEAVDQMNQKVVEVESVIEQVAAKLTSAEEVLEDMRTATGQANTAAAAADTAREGIQTDLGAKADKAVPSAAGNVALLSAEGNLQDSGVNIDYMPSYYGIEWDSSVSSPACTRIGRMDLHVSLPIQSKMRRCILQDDGTVAYYLDANDSTKSETGAAAKLDGR